MTWKRAVVCALWVAALGVVVYESICAFVIRRSLGRDRVRDAIQMAAPSVLGRLRTDAPDDPQLVLDQVLRMHHDSSVSPIWFDESFAPVDEWGNRFRARTDAASPPAWVVCESAGSDGEFDTDDDISAEARK